MFELNPKYTFFGDHYDRLKAIKNAYDPIGLFVVKEGVGSDDWDTSLNCRKPIYSGFSTFLKLITPNALLNNLQ
jgi:Berberine and berberine like